MQNQKLMELINKYGEESQEVANLLRQFTIKRIGDQSISLVNTPDVK